jgi:hypothetical protein
MLELVCINIYVNLMHICNTNKKLDKHLVKDLDQDLDKVTDNAWVNI